MIKRNPTYILRLLKPNLCPYEKVFGTLYKMIKHVPASNCFINLINEVNYRLEIQHNKQYISFAVVLIRV